MKKIPRRAFFKRLSHTVVDYLGGTSLVPTESVAKPPWARLVRFCEMGPGQEFPFEIYGVKGSLFSDAIGLRAKGQDGSCLAVRATSDGFVEVNVNEVWSQYQTLSHATSTIIFNE